MITYLSYSLFGLLDRYYEAKRRYYDGSPLLTDQEFDALEGSIKAIHGDWALKTYGCVGYDLSKHDIIKWRWNKLKKESTSSWY